MRRLFLLSLILIATSLSWPASAATSQGCSATNCTYLPIIGNPAYVYETQVFYRVIEKDGLTERCSQVINTLPVAIYDLKADISMYDQDHKLVDTFTGSAQWSATLPGYQNMLCLGTFYGYQYGYRLPTVEVRLYWSTQPAGGVAVSLTVVYMEPVTINQQPCWGNGVIGTLRNDNPWPVRNVTMNVLVSGTDSPDTPPYDVPMVQYATKKELAPGETTPFAASRSFPGCEYDSTGKAMVAAIGFADKP